MVKQLKNGYMTGDILAGNEASKDDNYSGESGDELREGIVFTNDEVDILFRSSMGRYVSLKDEDIVSEEDNKVYYPYYNETVCEVGNPHVGDKSLEKVHEDVSLKYTLVGGGTVNREVYIHSQLEVTAYSNNYVIVNDELYAVLDSLFHTNHSDHQKDRFLGLDKVNNGVKVKNVRSGQVRAIREQKIRNIFENESNNGALKVQNPDMDRYSPAMRLAEELDD